MQHIHALGWVNGDGNSVQILPPGCLRSFTDLMSTREDGQTHLLGIGAGSGQMPGAVAGRSSVLCCRVLHGTTVSACTQTPHTDRRSGLMSL